MSAHPFERHLANVTEAAKHHCWTTPDDGALPALYLSHGAPPLFEDAGWMAQLFAWARSLPKPKAVLIVSAHWEAAPRPREAQVVRLEVELMKCPPREALPVNAVAVGGGHHFTT